MNNLAFDLIHIEPRSSQYWHVGGRALTDICIGDILEIRLPDKTSMANKGSFVVIAISAYNVSMPKLSSGVSGMLTLQDNYGDLLTKGAKLVRATTESSPDDEQYRRIIKAMVRIRVEGDLRAEVLAFKQSLEAHAESIQFQPITAVGERFVAYGAVLRRATPSNIEQFIDILRRFNEKVDTLLGLSFVQHIRRENEAKRWEGRTYHRRKRSKWKLSFVQVLVKRRNEAKIRAACAANDQYLSDAIALGPRSEATAAFVLTMRCFLDDTEECSLENLAQYYQDATIGTEHARFYLANRNVYNIALDGVTELIDREQVVDHDGNVIGRIETPLTQRQVFDLWVYGGLSHANRTKKQQFDALFGDPVTRAMLRQSFVDWLDAYCGLLDTQRNISRSMILELEKHV